MAVIGGGSFAPFSRVAAQLEQEDQGRARNRMAAQELAQRSQQAQVNARLRQAGLDFQREQFEVGTQLTQDQMAARQFENAQRMAASQANQRMQEQDNLLKRAGRDAEDAIKFGIQLDPNSVSYVPIKEGHKLYGAHQDYLSRSKKAINKNVENRRRLDMLQKRRQSKQDELRNLQSDMLLRENKDRIPAMEAEAAKIGRAIAADQVVSDRISKAYFSEYMPTQGEQQEADFQGATGAMQDYYDQNPFAAQMMGNPVPGLREQWAQGGQGQQPEPQQPQPGAAPPESLSDAARARAYEAEQSQPQITIGGNSYRVFDEFAPVVRKDKTAILKEILRAEKAGDRKALAKARRKRREYFNKNPRYFYNMATNNRGTNPMYGSMVESLNPSGGTGGQVDTRRVVNGSR